jgi:hypothetical protein
MAWTVEGRTVHQGGCTSMVARWRRSSCLKVAALKVVHLSGPEGYLHVVDGKEEISIYSSKACSGGPRSSSQWPGRRLLSSRAGDSWPYRDHARFRGCWIQLKRKPDSRRQGQAKFDRGIGSYRTYHACRR